MRVIEYDLTDCVTFDDAKCVLGKHISSKHQMIITAPALSKIWVKICYHTQQPMTLKTTLSDKPVNPAQPGATWFNL